MPKERNHNFIVVPAPNVFYKIAPIGDPVRQARLESEAIALDMVRSFDPNLVTQTARVNIDGVGRALKLDRVEGLGAPTTFEQYAYVIERLQRVPVNDSLPTMHPSDYQERASGWIAYLRGKGAGVGLTKNEAARIEAFYGPNIDALSDLRTVFVHTDIQSRHVGTRNGKPVVIDFDQAHFGNELEDWAFLAIRHPKFETDIQHHLTMRLVNLGAKLDSFGRAFPLLKAHFLLKAYYDRTYQSRGKPFDTAAKVYVRQKLLRTQL